MNSYGKLYDAAVENYGIVTTSEAKSLGVSNMTLVQLARRGRLLHIRRGVYRLAQYVPTEFDDYAQAVVTVGEGAFLYGESVIALLKLAPTNPAFIHVAFPFRLRKKLPPNIILHSALPGYEPIKVQGIPCQRVADAVKAARATVSPDRLLPAAKEAFRKGFIDRRETKNIMAEVGGRA